MLLVWEFATAYVCIAVGGIALCVVLVWLAASGQSMVARVATAACYRHGFLPVLRRVVGPRIVGLELNDFGLRLYNAEDCDAAIGVFSAAIDMDPAEPAFWVNRGVAHYGAKHLDAAIHDLSRAIEINPAVEHARGHRGYCYFAKGMFVEALDDLSRHPCVSSSDAHVAYFRGRAYEQLLQWEQAAQEFEQACQLDGSYVEAGIGLARLQGCCPKDSVRNGEKALENARRVCILTEWKDWAAISVLAAAHASREDLGVVRAR